MKLFEKIFGTHSQREIKMVTPIVEKIVSYRDAMMALSDEQLRGKTDEFKKRLADGETLDDLLPEAYAVVRRLREEYLIQSISRYSYMVVFFFIRDASLR